jgi:KUP system potassium uptake protein
LHNLYHNKVLHERVVFLTVEIRDEPWVSAKERVVCQKLGNGCWRVRVSYGFLDRLDVTKALGAMARNAGSVTDYFNIPNNRVIELGTRIEI